MTRKAAWILMPALLAACVQFPQTPQETREYIRTSTMGKVQSFEVRRPYREVSRTFQARATECLSLTVRATERGGGSASTVRSTYRPTVVADEKRTELRLQQQERGNVIIPGKEPEGGFYVVLADATPASANSTKVEIYSASRRFDIVVKAITGWAEGGNLGCPDMTAM
jgi:hypothetical protein